MLKMMLFGMELAQRRVYNWWLKELCAMKPPPWMCTIRFSKAFTLSLGISRSWPVLRLTGGLLALITRTCV